MFLLSARFADRHNDERCYLYSAPMSTSTAREYRWGPLKTGAAIPADPDLDNPTQNPLHPAYPLHPGKKISRQ